MPDSTTLELDAVFMALADATRRDIVHHLSERDHSVGELAAYFEMSLAAVSKHIKVLEAAGVIKRRVDGRTHTLSLAPEQLAPALDWISIYRNFWQKRLKNLSDLLTQEETP